MLTLKGSTGFALFVGLLLGCAKSDNQATDTAATQSSGLAAADLAGRWNMKAVPFSGDTTPTTFVLDAQASDDGWTLTFPDRPPLPARVRFDADSVVTSVGPYESVRRKGVQVRTSSVMRLDGDSLVGSSMARYSTPNADSVIRFRTSGTRAR
jgi:hypothetical protein